MYERCLSEAERVVAAHKEVVVPVRTVWQEVMEQSRSQGFDIPTVADFSTMLEADSRFEFLPSAQSISEQAEFLPDTEDLDELELEKLGFFGKDRVKLKRVRLPMDLEEDVMIESFLPTKTPPRNGPGAKTHAPSPKVSKRKIHPRATRGNRVLRRSLKKSH
ncbi:MAG: hypothetical protein AAB269_04015 [Bacteroidota bacterium]